MKSSRMVWSGVFSAMLIAGVAPVARSQHITSFRAAGTCVEYGTLVPVDAARAQAAIPEEFVVREVAGRALVVVFAEDCTTSVEDGPAQRSVLSGVFVMTDPARSPGECASYDWFWQENLETDWVRANRDLGWDWEVIPSSSFAEAPLGFEMDIPSPQAPWSAKPAAVIAVGPAIPIVSVHCSVGARGLVRATYDHQVLEVGSGAGAVTLGSGPLWVALGARTQDAMPGLAVRFTWQGLTELG